ncbi:hypothetical protein IFR05_011322 [Cadophora sp. M221]|nr:hypothetical protein IFR05_011322 [Cadophora sp. M221]
MARDNIARSLNIYDNMNLSHLRETIKGQSPPSTKQNSKETHTISTLIYKTQYSNLQPLSPSSDMETCPSTSVPTFTIIRDDDLTLHFHPPHGSLALINALAIKYPLEPDLESQMRRALLEFITIESQSEPSSRQSPTLSPDDNDGSLNDHMSITPPQRTSNLPQTSSESPELSICKPRQQQAGRKSRYTPKKRRKVAEVRKHGACDYHREKKLECNCLFQRIPDTAESSGIDPGLRTESIPYNPQLEPTVQQDNRQGNNFPFYNFDQDMASSSGIQTANFPQLSSTDITYFPSSTQPPTPSTWPEASWH